MTSLPVSGAHRERLADALKYIRDARVSDVQALDMLEKICTVAFRDGCTAVYEQTLRDLALIKADVPAVKQ